MKELFKHKPTFAYLTKNDVEVIKAWVALDAKNQALKLLDGMQHPKIRRKLSRIVHLDSDQQLIVRMAQELDFLQEQLRG